MADNFLERHREEYEQRKAAWLRKKKHLERQPKTRLQKPDDEALWQNIRWRIGPTIYVYVRFFAFWHIFCI